MSKDIALFIIGSLLSIIGVLAMMILLDIKHDIESVKHTVDGICDTQAQYWPDHACKRK